LQVPAGRIDQKPTSKVELGFNLDAADPIKPLAFEATEGGSFNYSTSMKLVDKSGMDVQTSLYFKKTAANAWDVYATANGVSVPAGATPVKVGDIGLQQCRWLRPAGTRDLHHHRAPTCRMR
jgi:flagellar hook protein FlgE